MAEATPAIPKKGAKGGHASEETVDMMDMSLTCIMLGLGECNTLVSVASWVAPGN